MLHRVRHFIFATGCDISSVFASDSDALSGRSAGLVPGRTPTIPSARSAYFFAASRRLFGSSRLNHCDNEVHTVAIGAACLRRHCRVGDARLDSCEDFRIEYPLNLENVAAIVERRSTVILVRPFSIALTVPALRAIRAASSRTDQPRSLRIVLTVAPSSSDEIQSHSGFLNVRMAAGVADSGTVLLL